MRKIELASWKDVPRRVASLGKTLETIYGVELGVDFEDVPVDRLYPTESFFREGQACACFYEDYS